MKRLIVNADDFGLSAGVNAGIVRAYLEGIVTSATVMVGMPRAPEAFAIARANPGLGVGLHVTLTAGRPLAGGVESLVGPDGRFWKLPQLAEQARPEHIAREVQAQVQAFLDAGLVPTHLDSHHHVHLAIPAVGEAVDAAARALGVPVRGRGGLRFTDAFYGRAAVAADDLLRLLGALPDGLTELMCHPACPDAELAALTSYAAERELELAALTDPRVLAFVRAQAITLSTYRDAERG